MSRRDSGPSVVCILVPRFELLTAAGRSQRLPRSDLLREPVALAPEAGRDQVVGEVSGAAEAFGIKRGMRLSEALARCPELRLVAADPGRAAVAWESVLLALEGIGAAPESGRPGEAYFEADALRRLYGGHLEGVLARAREAVRMPARIGVGPSRFCSFAAARRTRSRRRAMIVPNGAARAFLAPLPVELLCARPELVAGGGLQGTELLAGSARSADLPAALDRLGIRTLGELSALPVAAVADRFGRLGLRARELALGLDAPLEPRPPRERLVERIDLPEAASGQQLERMLELLIDRLLARPERRGRALRKLWLGARFVEQGTWRREVPLREAAVARDRLRLALGPKLAELEAPIEQLSIEVAAFGPPVSDQLAFKSPDESERRRRLAEALRQTRAVAGAHSVLRVLEVDPGSRIPERRAVLTPFTESVGS
jgi:protein ImuB